MQEQRWDCGTGLWEMDVGNLQVGKKRSESLICIISEMRQLQGTTISGVRIVCFCFRFLCLAREEPAVLGKSVLATPECFCSCGRFWCVRYLTWLFLICSLSLSQEHDFAKRIEEVKPMFVEPRNKGSFAEVDCLHDLPITFSETVLILKYYL